MERENDLRYHPKVKPSFGLPYRGSKARIAKYIISMIPSAPVFIDLFAGGCAVTDCALRSGKFAHVIANDITDSVQLFRDAVHGRYKDEARWISRKEFYDGKDKDPYIRMCWSFGNDCQSYLYARGAVEEYKHALHDAYVLCDNTRLNAITGGLVAERHGAELYRFIRDHVQDIRERFKGCSLEHVKGDEVACLQSLEHLERLERLQSLERLESLEHLERLQSLERLERLQSLEHLERLQCLEHLEHLERLEHLEISQKDYRDVVVPANAVVYCDPPYQGTNGYGMSFDNEAFWQWCRDTTSRGIPVYISELSAPDDFKPIFEMPQTRKVSQDKASQFVETLFAHESLLAR